LGEELKSLFTTFFTSSVFRIILIDAISLGREWVARGASDISNISLHVHDIAENVKCKVEKDEFDRKSEIPTNCATPRVIAASVMGTASDMVRGVQESIKEKKKEWDDHIAETEGEVKQRLLTRIQEVSHRFQNNSSFHDTWLP